MYDGNGEYYC
jgi:hypothetical protein